MIGGHIAQLYVKGPVGLGRVPLICADVHCDSQVITDWFNQPTNYLDFSLPMHWEVETNQQARMLREERLDLFLSD